MEKEIKITINSLIKHFTKNDNIKGEMVTKSFNIPLEKMYVVQGASTNKESFKNYLEENGLKIKEIIDNKPWTNSYTAYCMNMVKDLDNTFIKELDEIKMDRYHFKKMNKREIDLAYHILEVQEDNYGFNDIHLGYIYINKNRYGEYVIQDYLVPNGWKIELI